MNTSHQDLILDQFTRQAVPFAEKPEHRDADLMERLIRFSGVHDKDRVLDVACGPGLMTTAFAERAREVTGIDLTPAMIAQARARQAAVRLSNLTWEIGDSMALPYPDGHFSLVVTRYSFHHFPAPLGAWKEMVRVCQPGGTVMVADVALPPEKAAAYDQFERLRDPSHTRALTLAEFPELAREAGLVDIRTDFFRLEMETKGLIESSFPLPENRGRLLQLLRDDLGGNEFGFNVEMRGAATWISFPILAVAGRKPAPADGTIVPR